MRCGRRFRRREKRVCVYARFEMCLPAFDMLMCVCICEATLLASLRPCVFHVRDVWTGLQDRSQSSGLRTLFYKGGAKSESREVREAPSSAKRIVHHISCASMGQFAPYRYALCVRVKQLLGLHFRTWCDGRWQGFTACSSLPEPLILASSTQLTRSLSLSLATWSPLARRDCNH